jgi:hypothetical protein
LIISAKALFGLARSGISTWAAMPIGAGQAVQHAVDTRGGAGALADLSSRAVNTRCQMSWPIRMPKK